MSAPGLSATVGEEIEALRRVAGDSAVKLIREVPERDHRQDRRRLAAQFRRASARCRLALWPSRIFDEIIRIHIEDELGGKIGG